jgi:hypothetical protein
MLATPRVSPPTSPSDSTGSPRSRRGGERSIMDVTTMPSGNANERPRDVSSSRPPVTSTRPGEVVPCSVQMTGSWSSMGARYAAPAASPSGAGEERLREITDRAAGRPVIVRTR